MKQYLVLFQGILGQATRPTRMANYLAGKGKVTICAYGQTSEAEGSDHEFILLNKQNRRLPEKVTRGISLFLGRFESDLWSSEIRRVYAVLKAKQFDGIFCHDPTLLPLALALRDKCTVNGFISKVIVDIREYYPRHFEEDATWRYTLGKLNHYIVKRYFNLADKCYVVSSGIQQEFERCYGIKSCLLPSFSIYSDVKPHNSGAGPLRCIHHGGAKRGRKLELLIESMSLLDSEVNLDLMLMPNDRSYYYQLVKMGDSVPNVNFITPVSLSQIVAVTSKYDVGIHLLPPVSFNHQFAMPNKLFEFIQARLAIVVGPSPDMAEFVLDNELGVVADDFTSEALAACLRKLTRDDINRFKENADTAARKYCWERNEAFLDRELAHIFN